MNRVETTTFIEAPPERVWAELIDFEAYTEWSPVLRRISGDPIVGARLSVTVVGPGGREWVFRPRILDVRPCALLRWRARLLMPGLLTGVHEFALRQERNGTRLIHADNFSGFLVPIVGRLLAGNESRMNLQNTALKQRAERGVRRKERTERGPS